MRVLDSTRTKIGNALTLADELSRGDFPNQHARLALLELKTVFADALKSLNDLSPDTDPDVIRYNCAAESVKLHKYFPYLGFLSRSADTRNAFEVHGPLLRVVRRLLDNNTYLVVSSEWEYTPFVFVPQKGSVLSSTVMIGTPASESSNVLTLPLAGHELGHSVWSKKDFVSKIGPIVYGNIVDIVKGSRWNDCQRILFPNWTDSSKVQTDLIARSELAPIYQSAILQCEEIFCDCLGLLLFREAFVHAFQYFLAPGLHVQRSHAYPPVRVRAELLEQAAQLCDISVPKDYSNDFDDEITSNDEHIKLILSIADETSESMLNNLLELAQMVVSDTGIIEPSTSDREAIMKCFAMCVPPQKAPSLAAIVNGAWDYYNSGMSEWRVSYPEIFDNERALIVLSDLAYKAIEIHEIEERLK